MGLGIAFAGLTIALLRYATGPDDYYLDGETLRWEHATGLSGAAVFSGGIAVSAACALGLLLGGLGWRRWNAQADVVAALSGLVALVSAWVGINAGH